jgi:hypothetical protein
LLVVETDDVSKILTYLNNKFEEELKLAVTQTGYIHLLFIQQRGKKSKTVHQKNKKNITTALHLVQLVSVGKLE